MTWAGRACQWWAMEIKTLWKRRPFHQVTRPDMSVHVHRWHLSQSIPRAALTNSGSLTSGLLCHQFLGFLLVSKGLEQKSRHPQLVSVLFEPMKALELHQTLCFVGIPYCCSFPKMVETCGNLFQSERAPTLNLRSNPTLRTWASWALNTNTSSSCRRRNLGQKVMLFLCNHWPCTSTSSIKLQVLCRSGFYLMDFHWSSNLWRMMAEVNQISVGVRDDLFSFRPRDAPIHDKMESLILESLSTRIFPEQRSAAELEACTSHNILS